MSECPDSIANQSPDHITARASESAHQQIVHQAPADNRVLIAVLVVLALATAVAIGLSVHANASAWDANREGRIAQSHIDEVRRDIIDPLKAKVDVLAQSPPTLVIKEECHR